MRRQWTEQEEKYMLKKYLLQPVAKTAKVLRRTEISVKRKASKMGLNHYLDNLNAKAIAKCFHCDVSVIIRWITKFQLPAKEIKCSNQTRYIIDAEEFWKWAWEHRDLINWARYEIDSLPPEPIWVKDEKKNFQHFNSRKRFSDFEKMAVRSFLRQGKTCEEISKETGRSCESIKHLKTKLAGN